MLFEVSESDSSLWNLLFNDRRIGLAETLHSEFMLYGIDVHVAFPGTMYTKGLQEENECKPKITRKLEETDGGATPEVVAKTILRGMCPP